MGDAALVDSISERGFPTDRNAADPVVEAIKAKATVPNGEASGSKKDETKEPEEKDGEKEDKESEEAEENEGEPEVEEQDEEASEEEEDAEEESDNEDPELTITVDGEQKTVKFSELTKNYALNGATEKRLQQATELRNGYYQVGQQLYTSLQSQAAKLQQIDDILKEIAEPQIDWEKLRVVDPNRYLIEKERVREAQDKRARLKSQQDAVEKERNDLIALNRQINAQAETGKFLEKMPALRDPAVAKQFYDVVDQIGTQVYGFSQEELGSVADHRQMLVLTDAIKYRMLMNKQGKTKDSSNAEKLSKIKPMLKPGANKAVSNKMAAAREVKANIAKARASGSPEDVAKLLIVRRAK